MVDSVYVAGCVRIARGVPTRRTCGRSAETPGDAAVLGDRSAGRRRSPMPTMAGNGFHSGKRIRCGVSSIFLAAGGARRRSLARALLCSGRTARGTSEWRSQHDRSDTRFRPALRAGCAGAGMRRLRFVESPDRTTGSGAAGSRGSGGCAGGSPARPEHAAHAATADGAHERSSACIDRDRRARPSRNGQGMMARLPAAPICGATTGKFFRRWETDTREIAVPPRKTTVWRALPVGTQIDWIHAAAMAPEGATPLRVTPPRRSGSCASQDARCPPAHPARKVGLA